jgi:peptidoglycan L-alanyl-D-glutamate endopeptidase CwlK
MYYLGPRSLRNLATCHKDLQVIAAETIKLIDFAVTDGQRGREQQEAAVRNGTSKLHFPDSLHNHAPSRAMDCAPWPIDYNNKGRFADLGHIMMKVADDLYAQGVITHKLRWGHDWDMDGVEGEKGETDMPHFELMIPKKGESDA